MEAVPQPLPKDLFDIVLVNLKSTTIATLHGSSEHLVLKMSP